MTEPANPDQLAWPLLRLLRTCAAGQFGAIDRPVCRFPLLVGDSRPPADNCDCDCADGGQGLAWVRLARQRLADTGGRAQVAGVAGCAGGDWLFDVELGVYRCWPSLDGHGAAPSDEDRTAAARGLLNDAAALRRTARCCEPLARQDVPWSNAVIDMIGPSGGCIGVAMTLTYALTDCACPEDET